MRVPPLLLVTSSLLVAVLLLTQCSSQAAAAHVMHQVKHHKHIPIMDAEQQKTMSAAQEKNSRAQLEQVVPIAPLNPDCVPKYVTDLVIPPPMPVSATPTPVVGAKVHEAEAEEEADEVQLHERHAAAEFKAQIASAGPYKQRRAVRASSVAAAAAYADGDSNGIFKSTDEYIYKSPLRKASSSSSASEDEEDDEPDKEAAASPKPKKARAPSINDDYWEVFEDIVPKAHKRKAAAPPPKKEPTDEAYDSHYHYRKYPRRHHDDDDDDDEHKQEDVDQESPYGGHHDYYPRHPKPHKPPPPEEEPEPPVQPPPVVPPPVVDPPVVPPPVVNPPVVPPPVVDPPVVPPPVQPPPPTFYDISVRQILQNVLPPQPTALPTCPVSFSQTTVYAYGPANVAGQPFHNWPGFTIEAQRNVPAHITWINDLKDATGAFQPHILRNSIDQTIHWANPAALGGTIDSSPCHACAMGAVNTCATDPGCTLASTSTYTGPVPTVTHVHGQTAVYDFADGYTEAWYMPAANNLAGFFDVGTFYDTFEQRYTAITGQEWAPGTSTGIYKNNQRASTLWYHDHTLGLTRTNVFAGLAGFYMVREKFPNLDNGPELPGIPYPAYDGVIPLELVRELPLAIQDRSFTTDSQLWYPVANNPAANNLPTGPLHPRWIPEYSATVPVNGVPTNMLMMTVNGRTYPKKTVFPDAYRVRILNGCNSRTLQLRFARSSSAQIDPLSPTATANLLPFYVIGNEGGWFPELQPPVTTLEVGPAERYDVILDFTGLAPGQFVFMLNNGPEIDTAVYDGTNNGVGLTVHTAQIMRFDVSVLPGGQIPKPFDLTQQVQLNTAMKAYWAANQVPLTPSAAPAREVTLLENLANDGTPIALFLGTAAAGTAVANAWQDPVATDVALGVSHYWDIINLSADAHPIHLHNVDFEYLGRFALQIDPLNPRNFVKTTTPVTNPDLDPWLTVSCGQEWNGAVINCPSNKDSIMVLPGSYTRIGFNAPAEAGLYVWHCHLLEHEDNEMMVPFCFGSPTYPDPRRPGQLMCPGPN